jgi:transposase InsO family protein
MVRLPAPERYGFRHSEVCRGDRSTYVRSCRWRTRSVRFSVPHGPWQNGKVERFDRTPVTEWAYRQVFTSNSDRTAALAPWLEYYNTRRRHSSLGGLPPISRLLPT